MKTKGELISRLRNRLKELTSDSNYSNRFLWSEISSAFNVLLKRETSAKASVFQMDELWTTICVPMVPVSSLLCDCLNIKACTLYRSAFKIPKGFEDYDGILYRFLATPDNSVHFTVVSPHTFQVKTSLRFNRGIYAFFHNGYIWTNQKYPKLIFSSIFTEDVSHMACESKEVNEEKKKNLKSGNCPNKTKEPSNIPGHLEQPVLDIAFSMLLQTIQRTTDNVVNSSESQREISN